MVLLPIGLSQFLVFATEEDGWALAEESEDIQDEVVFADGAWNENAAVFELKDSLDTVLALDVDDAVTDDEVVKEAGAAAVERVSVDFPGVGADRPTGRMRRLSAMLWLKRCWLLQVEHLRPGGVLIASRRARAGCALVSTPPWSLRPPTCEPELRLVIGKSDEGEWQADDPDAFAAQEERRSSWRRAKRGGVVACGVVAGSGELPGSSSVSDGHACVPRALAVRAINDDPAVSSDGGLAAQRTRRRCVACVETLVQQARALIVSTHWTRVLGVVLCLGFGVGCRCG